MPYACTEVRTRRAVGPSMDRRKRSAKGPAPERRWANWLGSGKAEEDHQRFQSGGGGMTSEDCDSPVFLYPDPSTGPEVLSGAAFLYFQGPLVVTLPPTVLTEGSSALLPLVRDRRPKWSNDFRRLLTAWHVQHDGFDAMMTTLEPLKGKHILVAWEVYPADTKALDRAASLAASSGMSLDAVAEIINPINAGGELLRHIMLEAFLELGKDIEALFEYCGRLFHTEPLDHLLAKAYLLRLPIRWPRVLLTNERLFIFLCNLPVETEAANTDSIDRDVIAWEVFRHIVSRRLDPLDSERVELIAGLVNSSTEQIHRLRIKCAAVADQLRQPTAFERLPSDVERLIRVYVEKEIADLLELDRRALQEYLTALFADYKTWAGVAAFVGGVVTGHVHVSAGGAIAALSSIGAQAFKTAAERRERLRKSDFALVYTIAKRG